MAHNSIGLASEMHYLMTQFLLIFIVITVDVDVVVVVFSNFTIVTGDSLGNTQFWDGLQGTLIQVS